MGRAELEDRMGVVRRRRHSADFKAKVAGGDQGTADDERDRRSVRDTPRADSPVKEIGAGGVAGLFSSKRAKEARSSDKMVKHIALKCSQRDCRTVGAPGFELGTNRL